MSTETDVVIAGGGPVGLMLAAELALAGVRTTVLEREPTPPPHARAWGLHARTAETLDRRGLLAPLLHEKARWPKMPFAGLWPLLELSALDSDHPYLVNVPQTRVEAVLADRAASAGAAIRRGGAVVGLRQDADGVVVEATGPDGVYEIRALFAVGCDGGRSTVRELAGIDFPGTDPTVGSLLCDCTLPTMADERRGITRTERGTVNINPRPSGEVRIVTTEFGRPHADRGAPVTAEEFRAAVRRVLGRDLDLVDPTYLTRFGDATRQARRYRAGRVLLAGDAAHVHFPYGGLGLNLGLQDAVNLGWKLAAEVSGWASEGLLDSYEAERHPVAAAVLEHSRTQLALLNPDRNVTALRVLFGELLAIPEVNRLLAARCTGTDTEYPGARFAADLALSTADGVTRLSGLLYEGRGVLVDLTGEDWAGRVAAPWAERVRVISATAEGAPAAALLVRPDGYLAWSAGVGEAEPPETGPQEAGLREALRTWFGVVV
ncbi:monooxygenase, FAD-binding [Actinokineospora spheciospongiae]|uniref:Monooxygenase, FAD-binding n=1 Tax=Actinokineospora spheciospongiae TaxID=909613 RepID=W7ISJ0_9PSEU|nr:FAD-dependent monooxygenase [Actinokineospora spheciospongiae]EWC63318.1 monooxygenase, FAD-binding [Actinokineospora spheciospongiae]